MRMRASLCALLTLMVSLGAEAAPTWLQSTLKFVYPFGDGSFVLGFTNDAGTCTSTAMPTKYFYVTAGQNGVTADGVKSMLAAALTGFAAGSTLAIAYDDGTPYCYINRFTIQ